VFGLRGIKGWAWRPEQYLETIPHLRPLGFTFLANCYASMTDIEHVRWGVQGGNRWWEPLREEKRRAYERVVREAHGHGLEFWFSMNPNLFSDRIARASDAASMDALWHHYDWMQGLGVRTFCVALDDIGQGIDPADQARLVNELLRRLRIADPGARMVFCPTIYWGDGQGPVEAGYLATIRGALDPDVRVFWTGDAVVTPRITRRAADGYRAAVGHELVIWDNYPVNDDMPTMHLGPLAGRDPDLDEVAVGYMANPMCRQHRLGLLPLATSAEYALDPAAYEPAAALGRAIERTGRTPEERAILAELVSAYPGMIRFPGTNHYFNPVRERIGRSGGGERERLIGEFESLVGRFERALGERYPAELVTLTDDLAWLEA
jgi:hyaluronoglucosaminidase